MNDSFERTYEVARRSFVRSWRQPATLIPSITFPLMLLAVNAAGLNSATEIPGFPTDSYISSPWPCRSCRGRSSRCSIREPTSRGTQKRAFCSAWRCRH